MYQTISLISGSSFSMPSAWEHTDHSTHQCVMSPEKDIKLYFMECVSTEDAFESDIHEACQQLERTSDLKVKQKINVPHQEGWEKGITMIYQTPISASQVMFGAGNLYQGRAYIVFCDATSSAMSRFQASVMSILESWKPQGFEATDLNHHAPEPWYEEKQLAFDAFIENMRQKLNIPGVSVALVERTQGIIYQRGFGVRQLGSDEPVMPDTPFMIGSTTKALTTLMMGMLIDKGLLRWDTLITSLLDDFKLGDTATTEKLTLKHTVSASTGMPRRDLDFVFKHRDATPESRLREMQAMKPTTKFGETFQYSNYLLMAGGYAAAKAYKPSETMEKAYLAAMRDLVFKPLKMHHTVLKIDDALVLGAASPHSINFEGERFVLPLQYESSCYSVAPAGAIWSSTTDLANYLLLEMNEGALEGEQLISKEILLERRKPGVAMSKNQHYGLGLVRSKVQGLDTLGHAGMTTGFSSECMCLPEKGLGIVMLCNTRGTMSTIYFIEAVKQKWFELTFKATPRSTELLQEAINAQVAEVQSMRAGVSTDPKEMLWVEDLLGEYQNDALGQLKVEKTNGSYRLIFEEWETRIGCHIEAGTQKVITFLDGPAPGIGKLQVRGNQLVIDDGQQTTYCFHKLPRQAHHQEAPCSWLKYSLFGVAAVGALVAGAYALSEPDGAALANN